MSIYSTYQFIIHQSEIGEPDGSTASVPGWRAEPLRTRRLQADAKNGDSALIRLHNKIKLLTRPFDIEPLYTVSVVSWQRPVLRQRNRGLVFAPKSRTPTSGQRTAKVTGPFKTSGGMRSNG